MTVYMDQIETTCNLDERKHKWAAVLRKKGRSGMKLMNQKQLNNEKTRLRNQEKDNLWSKVLLSEILSFNSFQICHSAPTFYLKIKTKARKLTLSAKRLWFLLFLNNPSWNSSCKLKTEIRMDTALWKKLTIFFSIRFNSIWD